LQIGEPGASLYVPRGHDSHAVAKEPRVAGDVSSSDRKPRGHSSGSADCGGQYRNAGQASGAAEEGGQKYEEGQGMAAAVMGGQYAPGGHAVALADPGSHSSVAWHGSGVTTPSSPQRRPPGQVAQSATDAAPVVFRYVAGGQVDALTVEPTQ
jgi:hypothetical protein